MASRKKCSATSSLKLTRLAHTAASTFFDANYKREFRSESDSESCSIQNRKDAIQVAVKNSRTQRAARIDQILLIHLEGAWLRNAQCGEQCGCDVRARMNCLKCHAPECALPSSRDPAQNRKTGMTESNVAKFAKNSRVCFQCCAAEFQQHEKSNKRC